MMARSENPLERVIASPALGKLTPELEQMLKGAIAEITRGEYVDLAQDALDRWVDAGVSPWPDAFPD
jgi:hypothetical protein